MTNPTPTYDELLARAEEMANEITRLNRELRAVGNEINARRDPDRYRVYIRVSKSSELSAAARIVRTALDLSVASALRMIRSAGDDGLWILDTPDEREAHDLASRFRKEYPIPGLIEVDRITDPRPEWHPPFELAPSCW